MEATNEPVDMIPLSVVLICTTVPAERFDVAVQVRSPSPLKEEKPEPAPEPAPSAPEQPAGQPAGGEAKAEAPKEEGKEGAAAGKRKKIKRLTLPEIEQKLKDAESKMGGTSSVYIKQLQKRKNELLGKPAEEKK